MNCSHKQICSVCDAPFKMERGCSVEKKCPACRFLNLNTTPEQPFVLNLKKSGLAKGAGVRELDFRVYDESFVHHHYARKTYNILREEETAPEYSMIKNEGGEYLIETLREALSSSQLSVLVFRLGLMGNKEHTFEEISEVLSISVERARQIEIRAMKNVKHPKYSRRLAKYFLYT